MNFRSLGRERLSDSLVDRMVLRAIAHPAAEFVAATLAPDVPKLSIDGPTLHPPGSAAVFLATAAPVDGRTATVGAPAHDGLPVVGNGNGPADLAVIEDRGDPRRAIKDARKRSGALVAAPASPDGPFDRWGADVVLLTVDQSDPAKQALAAGVRAAGRPLVVRVTDPQTDPDTVTAALDVAASGAIVDTGDPEADRRLAEQILDREAHRLDGAAKISVVVCAYNGGDDLDRCLTSLKDLPYPNYEVVVIDDGSKDDSVAVARSHGVKVVPREGGGLSRARNAGLEAAEGDIVVFLDQDAEATPGWLPALYRIMDRLHADGATGPNLPFPDAPFEERVVSGAPGAAIPVVQPDGTCTHMAGCNMAFNRAKALEIGGFNPTITGAYDDVEFCFRMQAAGGTLVLHPRAEILHHRRPIEGYLRQQRSYVKADESAPAAAQEHSVFTHERRSLLQRANPLKPRYVFVGPQATQRYSIATQPLNYDLPMKALIGIKGGALLTLIPASRARQLPLWAAFWGAAGVGFAAWMLSRVPAFRPDPGPRGLLHRLATAYLWLAFPVFRWRDRRRFREGTS